MAMEDVKNTGLKPSIEETKLFLGGLSQQSTKDTLKAYFSKFGPVLDIEIMMDPVTKKSRGFGFVKYINPETATETLASGKDHIVDGKNIEVKVAYKKGEEVAVQKLVHNSKVFVGGLTKEIDENKLKEYFSNYGTVTGVVVKKEVGTGEIRGFGFVEFASYHNVEAVLAVQYHTICGKQVEAKRVEPKGSTRPPGKMKMMHGYDNSRNFGRGGGGGGRGRGRGSHHPQPYGGGYGNGGQYNQGGPPQYGMYQQQDYSYQPQYNGPPPPIPPQVQSQPPPAQYGYNAPPTGAGRGGYAQQPMPPPPQPPIQPAAPVHYPQDPNASYSATPQARQPNYQAPPPQTAAEVGYPPTVGYNSSYNQPTATGTDTTATAPATGYQQPQPPAQQQPQSGYYDQQNTAGQQQGYGRGTAQPPRGGGTAGGSGYYPPGGAGQQQWAGQ